jgi:hypothetical protein
MNPRSVEQMSPSRAGSPENPRYVPHGLMVEALPLDVMFRWDQAVIPASAGHNLDYEFSHAFIFSLNERPRQKPIPTSSLRVPAALPSASSS